MDAAHETARTPLVELRGVSKAYGENQANKDISLRIYPGRIKALLGENGAGKSTLMSILAGHTQPDSGRILVNGKPVVLHNPKQAFEAGIGMVYQHFMLVDNMSVTNNVLLGQKSAWLLRKNERRERVRALSELYGIPVDPRARISALSMGEKQRVEILKLLCRESRVLILDEPTAVLTPTETEQLFTALRRMAADGKAIVFISHKLHEVLSLVDEVAILRRGEIVDEFARSNVPDEEELARRMFGRKAERNLEKSLLGFSGVERIDGVDALRGPNQPEDGPATGVPGVSEAARKKTTRSHAGEKRENSGQGRDYALRLEEAGCENVSAVSFNLERGQTLAILGVAGNGQKELVEMICGLRRPRSGQVNILGRDWQSFYSRSGKRGGQRGGLVYIPEDRRGLASCEMLDLADNFLLTTRALFTRFGLLRRKEAEEETRKLIEAYEVRPGVIEASARSLSGGNLQKLIIARELYREPQCIVAENPTQGLDVSATADVWQRLADAKKNAGVLLITGDLNEALHLADFIGVMFRGRLVGLFPLSDKAKVERIGLMMAGG